LSRAIERKYALWIFGKDLSWSRAANSNLLISIPRTKGQHENHQTAAAEIARHADVLARLQYKLYAEGKRSLLIVLQGLDASGKDGVIRHVMTGTNPQGVPASNSQRMRSLLMTSSGALIIVHPRAAR
jgi:polyphosphate kinase 2 (PPK2 family)